MFAHWTGKVRNFTVIRRTVKLCGFLFFYVLNLKILFVHKVRNFHLHEICSCVGYNLYMFVLLSLFEYKIPYPTLMSLAFRSQKSAFELSESKNCCSKLERLNTSKPDFQPSQNSSIWLIYTLELTYD